MLDKIFLDESKDYFDSSIAKLYCHPKVRSYTVFPYTRANRLVFRK